MLHLEIANFQIHSGDYKSIEGGYGGEGIEDLTGGVTSEIYTTDILDKEHFWKEELMKVNQDFLFGCSTGVWGRGTGDRKGIVELHAYSVLKAREVDGMRLVLLKNPWGKHEWKGAWSDGSKEWTAEWLQKLEHKFGDDGSFWISYEDLLKKYQAFDRTRLFGPEWNVASIWTTLNVLWTLDYHDTKFALSLTRASPVVLVLSQLDERYFKGLEGQYRFELSFRVHRAGEEDYVVRSQNYYRMNRSVNVELDLEAGEYVVVVRVDAQRNEMIMPVEEVVRAYAKERREKLLRIGLAYDVAHSKGKINETPEEKAAREAYENRKRDRERKKVAKLIMKNKEDLRKHNIREMLRNRKAAEKARARAKAKEARRKARREAKEKAEQEERKKKEEEEKEKEEQGGTLNDKPEEKSADKPLDEKLDQNEKLDQKNVPGQDKDSEGAERHQTEDSGHQTGAADGKCIKVDIPSKSNTGTESPKDCDSSISPGENTSASSKIIDAEESQEEDDYMTSAEQEGDSKPTATEEANTDEEPFTPKVSKAKTDKPASPPRADKVAAPPKTERVDIGVQTGPGIPFPQRMLHPPPGYLHSPPLHPQPHKGSFGAPHGGLNHHCHHHHRSPVGGFHLPPHTRGGPYGPQPPDVAYTSGSDESFSASDDGLDDTDPVSEVSEHDIDDFIEKSKAAAARVPKAPPSPQPQPVGSRSEDELDEFEKDPWNAVGVFGLRVYYKAGEVGEEGEQQGEIVRLRVERPNPFVLEDDSDDEADDEAGGDDKKKEKGKGVEGEGKEEANESQALDIDDSAKDAVAGGITAEEKKEDKEVLSRKDGSEEKKADAEKEIKKEEVDETGNSTQTDNTPTVVPKVEDKEQVAQLEV